MPVKIREKQSREVPGFRPGRTTSILLIHIRGRDGKGPYGDIISYDLRRTVSFQNLAELVFQIDAISRRVNPDAGEAFRSLRGRKVREDQGEEKRYVNQRDFSHQFSLTGGKALFCLELIGRKNMSLQGSIRGRLTDGRRIYFRSALELMVMLWEME